MKALPLATRENRIRCFIFFYVTNRLISKRGVSDSLKMGGGTSSNAAAMAAPSILTIGEAPPQLRPWVMFLKIQSSQFWGFSQTALLVENQLNLSIKFACMDWNFFNYITMFLLLRNLMLKLLISEFGRTFHSRIHVSFGTILSLIQHIFSL